ncbi:MAG: efflux RND transporter permease subunit [candidate division KSB1 bacterium]|nr:efflux RND transporter permease subunit [candidate division KSB1 bacterium]
MGLIRFVISRKTLVSMLFVGVTMLGYISYRQLPMELYPSADLPYLIVRVTASQEVDPEYLESQAIIPLEGVIGGLEGIDRIESFAEQRQGMIVVYFNPNVKMKYAYLRLQERVDQVRAQLPEIFSVDVYKVDTEQLTNQFMTLQVRGSGDVDWIRYVVDDKIVPKLESIDGIASVQVFGGRQRSVEIILDPEALRAFNLTPSQIRNLIRQSGAQRTFVGHVYGADRKYFVNVVADYTDVRDLENLVVRQEGPVLLKDVAQVYFGTKEQTSLSRVNGKEAVSVVLVRDAQTNLIQLAHATRRVIADLNRQLGWQGLEIVVQSDAAELMERNIQLIKQLALTGGLLAVGVLWVFLRNLRLVVIIALAIPISILAALNLLYALHVSLNSLTLVGMALAVGMLLDSSVVVLENIYRLRSRGQPVDRAVIQGTSEVWRSIVASTLTTMVVFLPFAFSSNFLVKLIGRQIGVSIVSTLSVSLLVALLLVPMIVHSYLARTGRSGGAEFYQVRRTNRLMQIYLLLLKSCLRFPARTVVVALVAFFASIFIALAVSLNVTREVDTSELTLYVTMPQGSTLENTDGLVREVEARLENLEEKQDVISRIYEDEAVVTVRLKENYRKIKGRDLAQVKEEIQNRLKDFRTAEISFEQPASSRRFRVGGGMSNPAAQLERLLGIGTQQERVVIRGQDFDQMLRVADDIRYYLENLSFVQTVRLNVSGARPEVHLYFDQNVMSQYNLTLAQVAAELATFGTEFSSGMRYRQGTEEYDITIRVQERGEERVTERSLDDLRSLVVGAGDEAFLTLEELSRIVLASGRGSIRRLNQEKQIEVVYQFLPDVNSSKPLLESARAEVDRVLGSLSFPAGIAVQIIHQETELGEFYFLTAAALILIYMILASVFESAVTPLVMMFTIPLAATGSLWALILTKNSLFNANTLTGFLILIGVVVNNGIILIDFTRILRQRGFRRSRALMVAGQARVRPILITAITTMIAMLPLAMGQVEYVAQIGAPFAITVIGGLAVSTLFTLVFIPTVYTGLETALQWFRGLDWRLKALQYGAFAMGAWQIYAHVHTTVWRLADLVLLALGIPALTYFGLTSLRRADRSVLEEGQSLRIRVRNLVKIYDWDSRFVREWKKGQRLSQRDCRVAQRWRDLETWIWKLPLLGFLVYFVYFYLRSRIWQLLLAQAVFFYVLHLWREVEPLVRLSAERGGGRWAAGAGRIFRPVFLWGFPFLNLTFFFFRWRQPLVVLFAGLVWYLALAIHQASARLYAQEVSLARIQGRFAGFRKGLYRLVMSIPILGRRKRPFKALDRVSLEIGEGMIGLVGPNGAGKTTLMRIICGILEQSYGKVWINGVDTQERREELQALIGYLPQEFGVYENMTAYEFLSYQAILKGLVDREEREKRIDEVLRAVHMEEHKHERIGSFSGGMKQRIGIAQTLLHLPRILVVDEPTAGLDPRERIRFRNLLVELSRNRIVLFSTHIIEDISSSCNQVVVLNGGRLIYTGTPGDMARQAEGRVWQLYAAPEELDSLRQRLLIVHHMRDRDRIRVRCLSEIQPAPEAVPVRPTLEDAYLWLLSQGKRKGDS